MLGVCIDWQVRVVRCDYQLPFAFCRPQVTNQRPVDETRVQFVLRLVNHDGTFPSREHQVQEDCVSLSL
ncbi:hypothetical protein D3C85_1725960 [compost metagenome]